MTSPTFSPDTVQERLRDLYVLAISEQTMTPEFVKAQMKRLGVRVRHLHDPKGQLGGTVALMDCGDGSFCMGASFVNYSFYRQVHRAANALRSLGVPVAPETLPPGPTRFEGRARALESLAEVGVVVRQGEIDFDALKPVVVDGKAKRNRKGEAKVLRQTKAILAAFKRLEKADVSSDDGLQVTA